MTESLHTETSPFPSPSELNNRFYNKRAAARGGWSYIGEEALKTAALVVFVTATLMILYAVYIWEGTDVGVIWRFYFGMMIGIVISTWARVSSRYMKPLGWLVTSLIALAVIAVLVALVRYDLFASTGESLTQFVIDHLILDFTSAGVA
jgi:hypothetical protein